MNCQPFEERIAQYVDGDLEWDEGRAVEEHLRVCSACAEFADRLEGDRIALRMPAESVEVDFADLRRQIRGEIFREQRRKRLGAAVLIAASILVAVGVGVMRFGVAPQTAQVETGSKDRPGDARVEETRQTSARVPTRQARVLAPRVVHVPQADPALEAALREFSAGEEELDVSPEAVSPVEIRIVTGDPNVILILLPETSGGPNE